MKTLKKLFLTLAVVTMAVVCFAFGATAETEGYYTYEVENGKAIITDVDDSIGGDVVIPDRFGFYPVVSIGYKAFCDCRSVKAITIPNSVTTIESKAFYNCYRLKKVYAADVESWLNINFDSGSANPMDYAIELYFAGELATDIVVPDNITSIGDYTFYDCNSLTSVTIPDSVTSIGNYAFYDCNSLESVTVGNGVITINDNAFSGCRKLTSIIIPDSVTNIGNSSFDCIDCYYVVIYCNKNSYAASYADKKRYPYVYIDGTDEESIISGKVGKYRWCLDKRTGVLELTGSGDMINFASFNAPWYEHKYYVTSLKLPEGLTKIGYSAFKSLYRVNDIEIPNSVTTIGAMAFYDCGVLNSVTIGENVTSIGADAFGYCDEYYEDEAYSHIRKVYAKDVDSWFRIKLYGNNETIGLLRYGAKLYFGNQLVTDIIVPENLRSIDSGTFTGCSSIQSVTISDNVTTISPYAFYNCDSLISITIPDSVTSIGSSAFSSCKSLTSITIGNGVTTIDSNAFYSCNSLISVAIPDNVATIGCCAFSNCKNLTSMTFKTDNKNQSKIASMPDISGTMIKEIVLPASICTIGPNVFPSAMEKVTVYNTNCTFNISCGLSYKSTIIGFKGSTAEKFAEQIGAEFIDVETVHSHQYKALKEKGYCSFSRCTCGKEKAVKHSHTLKTTKAATCTTIGIKTYTCICGDSYTETIAELGHKYASYYTIDKKATCKAEGSESMHCKRSGCTAKTSMTPIAKKAHTNKTTTTKATLTKNGKTETKCTVCGKVSKTTTVYYPKTITLSASSYTYNGKTKTPTVTVKDSKGKELKKDTDYTVKYESGRKSTGKYTVTVTFKGKYSGTKKLYFTITPKTTSKVTATQATTSVTLKWSKVAGATGYRVFQRVNGKWKTLTNTTKLTYTVKKLKAGTNYTFAVRPYTVDGKDTILASTFTQLKTATKCKTPTLKVTSSKKGVASLSWTNVAGESGYQVYYSTKKDGEYKKVKSYKTDVVTASKSKLTSGKTYYFKIRVYKKTDSGTVYGAWSAVKSVKIK